MKLVLFLNSPVRVFSPTDEQIARFAAAITPEHSVQTVHSEEAFFAALPDADAVICWSFRQEWFQNAPHLRHLFTPSAGRDYFHVSPPPPVTLHYGAFHGHIMGETAVAAILAFSRGLLPNASAMRYPQCGSFKESPTGAPTGAWPRHLFEQSARRLGAQTVLILGFGNIGRLTANFLAPFGCRILGITRSEHPLPGGLPPGSETGTLERLDEFLPRADHLVSFLPSDTGTDGILSAERFARMKPGAFFCNFGRGNCLDEAALCNALRTGKLAGALLDVFSVEPLPLSSPLRSTPNLYLLPHASAFAPDYMDLYFCELAVSLKERCGTSQK